MAKYSDEDGNSFSDGAVSAGEATRASDHNALNGNDKLWVSSKSVILAGNHTDWPADKRPYQESGAEFVVWRTFNDDGPTVTLVDVSDYEGILSANWVDSGFLKRPLYVQVWHVHDPSSVSGYIPGGAHDHELMNGAADGEFGWYVDSASATYVYTSGTHNYTFSIGGADYDLKVQYDDDTTSDKAAVIFKIWAGPRYRDVT